MRDISRPFDSKRCRRTGSIEAKLKSAVSQTYSYNDYNSTPGYMGWTYWDSLGQQMVWNAGASRWTCLNPVDPWCYWSKIGGQPGADRNVIRRWTAPRAGSARITGIRQKDSNVCGGNLISVGKPSTQSSCATGCWGGAPSRCNDGNTDGDWAKGSVCHTNYEAQPWYQIDLLAPYLISRIDVWNRSDNSGADEPGRATKFNVMTSLTGLPGSWTSVNYPGTVGYPTSTNYGFGITARYVRVQLVGTNYLHLAEVQVFGDGPDGVRTQVDYQSQQSNYYYTYTSPGPALKLSTWLGDMACSDNSAYSFDYDQELYPGDTLSFIIDRRDNCSWDSTTLTPTITFESADAIGSLDTYSSATPTTATVAFNGFLKCPNGSTCNYADTLPPDYYTIQPIGFFNSPPQPVTKLNNRALCGPADGPFCLNPPASHFSVTFKNLTPNYAHDKSGIKNMPKWLTHTNSLHQQAYKTALKRAVDGGLRLMVMHAVNSEFVCKVVASVRGNTPINCDDPTALDRQITAAYRFQSEIDREYCHGSPIPDVGLPNTPLSNEAPDYECGWYRIVTNPAAAWKVMSRGKLAVVLGIEATIPFGCGTGTTGPWGAYPSNSANVPGPRPTCMVGGGPVSGIVDILDPLDGASLQYFYNRGVRHVFPIHGINNGLGSAAISGASEAYAFNEAALNGAYFRTGSCLDRGAAVDGPLNFRLSLPVNATTLTLPLGLGSLSFTNIAGIPLAPARYPGGAGATCNVGGAFGSTSPPFGLTALGRSVIQEMMKRRMIIDVDHMSERSHVDTMAESAKSFNYPLVSGHTNLQRLSTGAESPGNNEFALSTPELNEVRASGGQVNLVALGAFPSIGVAAHSRVAGNAASNRFLPRVASAPNDCNDSSKAWVQEYLAAVELTRNAPMPNDNSAPTVYGVGFGSDINTIKALIQPRFGQVGGLWSGCSPPGGPTVSMNSQQQAQWDANVAGRVGKAVQYDVDMISGQPTTKGYGGIDTSLSPDGDPENNFPGFNGPRLRRSRLNEGGYLFTLYGPDKPVNGAPGGEVQTMCLDHGGHVRDGGAPLIGDCGNTRNINQQWSYDSAPSLRIRPRAFPSKNLVVKIPLEAVNNNNEYAVTYADSNVFDDYDHPAPEAIWTTWPTGQLYNALTGRCLSVERSGYGNGSRVVVAPCTAGNTRLPLRPDQIWARGGEEESFNLTGLRSWAQLARISYTC